MIKFLQNIKITVVGFCLLCIGITFAVAGEDDPARREIEDELMQLLDGS